MTWEDLIELEPKLLTLYNRALEIRKRRPGVGALDLWIGPRSGMKDEMTALVGWGRRDNPRLATSEAYDLAYDKIYYEALLGDRNERTRHRS